MWWDQLIEYINIFLFIYLTFYIIIIVVFFWRNNKKWTKLFIYIFNSKKKEEDYLRDKGFCNLVRETREMGIGGEGGVWNLRVTVIARICPCFLSGWCHTCRVAFLGPTVTPAPCSLFLFLGPHIPFFSLKRKIFLRFLTFCQFFLVKIKA